MNRTSVVHARIIDLIGQESARTLIERLGGMRVYVPQHPAASSPLVLAIGHAKAARLCDQFAGQLLELPSRAKIITIRRRDDIEYDIRRGLSSSEIAIRHGISERRVRQIRQGKP